MNKKSNNYRLNVRGTNFWVRCFNDDNESIYIKWTICYNYYLYMKKIKDDKYIDYITNRVFTMEDNGDYLIIFPGGIKVSKDCLEVCNNIEELSTVIMNDDEKKIEYFTMSEGIIYENYFCGELAYFYGLNVIPASYVDESIEYVNVNCSDDTFGRGRKLVQ